MQEERKVPCLAQVSLPSGNLTHDFFFLFLLGIFLLYLLLLHCMFREKSQVRNSMFGKCAFPGAHANDLDGQHAMKCSCHMGVFCNSHNRPELDKQLQ